MKIRTLLLAFSILALSLAGFAAPAAHAEDMTCPDMAPTIASLRNCVVHCYDMGYIDNRSTEQQMLSMLDAAQAAVNRGQTAVAIYDLTAFVQYVRGQAGVHITADHAAHMISHANDVIAALSKS